MSIVFILLLTVIAAAWPTIEKRLNKFKSPKVGFAAKVRRYAARAYLWLVVIFALSAEYFTHQDDVTKAATVDAQATALATSNRIATQDGQQIQALTVDVSELQRTLRIGAKPTKLVQVEALALSNDILKFEQSRTASAPPHSMSVDSATWEAATNKQEAYDSETTSLYLTQFGSKTKSLVDRLARVGVEDKTLTNDTMWTAGLMEPEQITDIAIRLGTLAREAETSE